ncbi:MAG: iron dicitrate transport regulator FecR, partial [Methylibium sp.]|nr:iron dicitrate transport regulator FecR [Methylibium sp.]
GALRVSGAFRTGDSVGFVRAVAVLHGLVVRELPDELELVQK